MRKVIYQVWLTPQQSPTGKTMLSDERTGFFHKWGLEIVDNGQTTCSQTVAIIEDEKTKGVSTTYPHLVAFVDAPSAV